MTLLCWMLRFRAWCACCACCVQQHSFLRSCMPLLPASPKAPASAPLSMQAPGAVAAAQQRRIHAGTPGECCAVERCGSDRPRTRVRTAVCLDAALVQPSVAEPTLFPSLQGAWRRQPYDAAGYVGMWWRVGRLLWAGFAMTAPSSSTRARTKESRQQAPGGCQPLDCEGPT